LFFGLKPEAVFAGFDCAMVEKSKVLVLGWFATATVWLQNYDAVPELFWRVNAP
jgi:hypothetical protein